MMVLLKMIMMMVMMVMMMNQTQIYCFNNNNQLGQAKILNLKTRNNNFVVAINRRSLFKIKEISRHIFH